MADGRILATAVAVVATAGGLGLVALPGVGQALGLGPILETVLVAVVGLLALAVAAWSVRDVVEADDEPSTAAPAVPQTERRPTYPVPGSTDARRIDEITWLGRRADRQDARESVRTELRDLAVDVLSRTENESEAAVEAALADGTWTDDEAAAAFFAGGLVPETTPGAKLRGLLTGAEPPFRRRARHAVAALAARSIDGTFGPGRPSTADNASSRLATIGEYRERQNATDRASGADVTGRRLVPVAMAVGAVGVLAGAPAVLLLAAFGVVAVAAGSAPRSATRRLEVERHVDEAEPDPGEDVEVTLRVSNAGTATVPDCRVVDGVPPGLVVTDGTPRTAVALQPGRSTTVTYTVEACRGRHAFDGPLLIHRGYTGLRRRERIVDDVETAITCRPATTSASEPAARDQATIRPARARPSVAGAGVEFHGVREYRPGDPPGRIDWNRRARTGDLVTVEFRESRLPKVVLVVDARRPAYVAPPGGVPAARAAANAAEALAQAFLDDGVPVGLAALSPRDCWIPAGLGAGHRRRLVDALATDPAFGWQPPTRDDGGTVDDAGGNTSDGAGDGVADAAARIRARLPADAQVVIVTPLADDGVVRVARRFDALGHAAVVWSDPPTDRATSNDLFVGRATLQWIRRQSTLRRAGIPVVDGSDDVRTRSEGEVGSRVR